MTKQLRSARSTAESYRQSNERLREENERLKAQILELMVARDEPTTLRGELACATEMETAAAAAAAAAAVAPLPLSCPIDTVTYNSST